MFNNLSMCSSNCYRNAYKIMHVKHYMLSQSQHNTAGVQLPLFPGSELQATCESSGKHWQ